MVVYYSARKYIQSCATLEARIAAIDAIIDSLTFTAASAAENDEVKEYQLNDGQTIIRETYRGTMGIAAAINGFEAIKQRYINQLNGRVRRCVDSKSFRTYGTRF